MFIFPGVGLGALLAKIRVITDGMFYAAANALAAKLTNEQLAEGKVYPGTLLSSLLSLLHLTLFPDISAIREVSRDVAVAVIKEAFNERLAGIDPPHDLRQFVEDHMYVPKYVPLIRPPFGVNVHVTSSK